jgi:PPM family protein phosphatase
MPGSIDPRYDVSSAISLGRRDCQEDAIICDFPIGSPLGFAVLSDGMGGHAAGDVASKIVVTEVFSELKLQSGDQRNLEDEIGEILRDAVVAANECIHAQAKSDPATKGLGATLVAPVLMQDRLYWISVGDSPLLLYRDGTLSQLNEDHSMAPQIDFLARSGLMDEDHARTHPNRGCLTSVLAGQQISRIDCPAKPMQMMDGDIIIAASDGLQFLENTVISDLLAQHGDGPSANISTGLMQGLNELNDPDQDNISFCVIKVSVPTQACEIDQTVIPLTAQTPAESKVSLSGSGRSVEMQYSPEGRA